MVHCGTNNSDHDEPKAIVDAIIKICKAFHKKLAADVNVISTGILPRDLNTSTQRNRIMRVIVT